VCGQGCAIQACFRAFFLAVKKNLYRRRPHLRHRTAGHAWSRAIAGAACPHQLMCIVEPDLTCACAGMLTIRVFLRSFLAGPQITCFYWHYTVYAARGGVVSSAFAWEHQLQRTQGTGVPAVAERACENSDLRRLADPLAAVRRCTLGHRAGGKALRRVTAGATCLQATVSRYSSDLHCVCDGSQCQRVLLARPESTAFLRVFQGPQPSRTATGHDGSPPIFSFVSALVFSLAPASVITHYLLKFP